MSEFSFDGEDEGRGMRFLDAAGAFGPEKKAAEWLVRDFLARLSIFLVVGAGGAKKSYSELIETY